MSSADAPTVREGAAEAFDASARQDAPPLAWIERLFGDAAYVVTDLDGTGHPVVHVSPAFERLTGHPAGRVRGRHLALLHRDDDAEDAQEVRAALAEGRSGRSVVRTRRADGSAFWNEQRHFPMRDDEGRVRFVVTVQEDVSDRMHALGAVEAGTGAEAGASFGYSVLLRDERPPESLWISDDYRRLAGGPDAPADPPSEVGAWVHPEDRARFDAALWARRRTAGHTLVYRLVTQDGRVRWVEDRARRTDGGDEETPVTVHALVRDVTEERRHDGLLKRLEGVDALTGLVTCDAFTEHLEQGAARARRQPGGAALVLLDLDAFGFVNATLGRRFGDRLLRDVATRLRRAVRRSDEVARDGDDRFALLLHGAGTPQDLVPVLEKLRRALARPYVWAHGSLELSASYGVVLLDDTADEARTLLAEAARALEGAKGDGPGHYRVRGERNHQRVRTLEAEGRELRRALRDDELRLHYQPRIDLHSGLVTGVEALVRWLHPDRGLLRPAQFLSQVEAARLDAELFQWVLSRALDQAHAWRAAGHPYRVAVNVGRQALRDPDFEAWVRDALAARDLNPALLELELTEDTPFEVFEERIASLRALRDAGVRISLDDFGVATASLSQLQRLPLDGLKIDRRFIERLEAGERSDLEMVRAIVAIGRSLSLTVVAEGIETEAQGRLLEGLHCDEGQGFLYGRAVPGTYSPTFASPAARPN